MADIAYIALGSNLGDRAAYLARAVRAMEQLPETRVVATTPVEETEPFGPPGQGQYLNQMVAVETSLAPHDLLRALQAIENQAGRVRGERWGPRTLDLDIVRFGHRTVDDPDLQLPHPGLPNRDFWQRQLVQLTRALETRVTSE